MERVAQYLLRYAPISEEAKAYLFESGKIKHYKKGDYYLRMGDIKLVSGFLLEGLISYEFVNKKGKVHIERVGTVNQYIEGTKHLYSRSGAGIAIRFLQNSTIYEIKNERLQYGIKHYAELNHIHHILKQHYVDLMKVFVRLPKLDREERINYLYAKIPDLVGQLTIDQLCSLLGYSNYRQYYLALDVYYRAKK